MTDKRDEERRWPWLLLVLGIFSLEVFPAMFAGVETMAPAFDANTFHIPQINHFIQHPFDLFGYPPTSATTPGHHVVLAWISTIFGYDAIDATSWPIRVLSALFGHGAIALAFVAACRLGARPRLAAIAVLPLACSSYLVAASIWIVTDNGAVFFFMLCLFVMLFHRDRLGAVAGASIGLVAWRQIYLPVVGAFGLPFLLKGRSKRDLIRGLAAVVPAVIVVGAFAVSWNGLTPGDTQAYNEARFQMAVPLHAFALAGLYAFPFGLFLLPVWNELDARTRIRVVAVVSVVMMLLWALGRTDFDADNGRWGSMVWLVAKKLPVVAGRSPAVLLLSILGGVTLVLMWIGSKASESERDDAPPELTMLALYGVGYGAQVMAWQRYLEPVFFMAFAMFASRMAPRAKRLAWAGPVLLALVFGAMGQARIHGLVGRLFG